MTAETTFWDKIARKYAARPVQDEEAYARTLDRVRRHLPARARVLELGCGTGTTALKLADTTGEMVATDVSSEMIAIAEEKRAAAGTDNVRFAVAGATVPDEPAGTFDAVLGFNLLHLIADRGPVHDRVHALLKPGGLYISKSPCLSDAAWYIRPMVWVMRMVMRVRMGAAPAVSFLSTDALEREITATGFEIIETGDYPAKPPNHLIVARKPA